MCLFYWVVYAAACVSFLQLDTGVNIQKGEISVEKWPPLDWPVATSEGQAYFNGWSERAEEPWARGPVLYKKTSRASQRGKAWAKLLHGLRLGSCLPGPVLTFMGSVTGMSKQMKSYLPSHFWPLFFTAIESKEDAALSTGVTIPVFFKKQLFELFFKRWKTGWDNGQEKYA